MSLDKFSIVKDRVLFSLGEVGLQSAKWLRRVGRGTWLYLQQLLKLLVRPDNMIPLLGNDTHWGFPVGFYLVFLLVMGLLDPLVARACGVSAESARVMLVLWVFFPPLAGLLTWSGLRGLYRMNCPLHQTVNVLVISLFPLILGVMVSTLFLLLNVGIGLAMLLFSFLVAFNYFSECIRLIFGLERTRRIYFAPLVVAGTALFSGLLLWLLFVKAVP